MHPRLREVIISSNNHAFFDEMIRLTGFTPRLFPNTLVELFQLSLPKGGQISQQ
jgi:hypothetical protein